MRGAGVDGGDHVLVPLGAVEVRAVVVDLDPPAPPAGSRSRTAADPVAERRVEDHDLAVGVLEQVVQLVVEVAVVDVDRHGPLLERGEVAPRGTPGEL